MVATTIAAAYFAAGTFAYSATVFAVNFALSQIITRVFGDTPSGPQDNGVRQQVPPSSANAIPIVYGDAYLGGTFVDAVLSTNQKAMYYVLAVSSISPNGQFTFDRTDMYFGDRKITFDTVDKARVVSLTDSAGNVDTKVSGYLWIGLYTSSQTGTITSANDWYPPSVIMGPTTPFSAYPIASAQQWPSTGRQMNGTAFAIATLIYSQDAGTTQLQPITFKVKQALNGTGVAKPGDVWADYISNVVYGGAVDSSNIDLASATALNAYSDQLITFNNSSGVPTTQPRYRINGVLDAGQTVLSNIDKIVTASDSWMTYNAAMGKWSIVINKSESAAYNFNDNNIIGEIRVSATDITSSINQIEAKFPFGQNRDQPAFVNLSTPPILLYPNEPVNKYTISYDLVNNSVQAQYLANRLLEQAREDLIVSFSTTYYGIQVDAGDVVTVTNSNYGWTNKLFRVTRVNEASLPDGSLGAKLELSEYNAAVYDDQDITAYTPAPNGSLPSPGYFSALAAPTVSSSTPSSAIPNFNVTVTIPSTGRVTYCTLFYTTSTSPTVFDWKLLNSNASIDGTPFTSGSSYVFANQVLPTGASVSQTYYFSYIVGNQTSQSGRSPTSFAFTWSPVQNSGPTGPRTSTGYVYYALSSATAPASPSLSGFNYTTGQFSSISANWSTTFNAPAATDSTKFWAAYFSVSEVTFGGAQTVTVSSTFNWTNFNGLVTFTNLATNTGTTFIDGGNITTNTINVSKLVAGLLQGYTFRTGTGGTPNNAAFEVGSTGVVWTDNIIGGVGLFDNTRSDSPAVYGFSSNNRNYPATAGYVNAANQAGGAHGLRGQNYRTGGSGLVGGANGYDFYADGTGTNYGPFTGNHDILVPVGDTLIEGDLVVDVQCIARKNWSNAVFEVAKSTVANQVGCRGVFIGSLVPLSQVQPAVFIESSELVGDNVVITMTPQYEQIKDQYLFGSMSAIGEGQIQVCGQGGDISMDTLIVTSDIAGVGMAQSDDVVRSKTVAKAREAVTFSSPTDVQVIACIYLGG